MDDAETTRRKRKGAERTARHRYTLFLKFQTFVGMHFQIGPVVSVENHRPGFSTQSFCKHGLTSMIDVHKSLI